MITESIGTTDEFRLPVLDDETQSETRECIKDGPVLKAEQRMAIYRQQYWFRLLTILQEAFPLLTGMFGYKEFNEKIGEPYLLSHPPQHWSLATLGVDLPEWMEKEYRESDKRLVLLSAKLDDAYERVFFAESWPFIQPEMQQELLSSSIYLQPYIVPLHMECDLFRYREEFLKEEVEHWVEHDFPELEWGEKRFFILYRCSEGILYEEISPPEYLLLSAFQKGVSLDDACAQVQHIPGIEEKLGSWFQKWMREGWLSLNI